MSSAGDLTQVIIDGMKKGDRSAFDSFFERQTPRVLVYINYNLGDRLRRKVDAADILQNLYLRLYRNFDSFMRRAVDRGVLKTLIRMADHEISEAYRYHFKVDKRDARREITAAYIDADRNGTSASPLDWVPTDKTSITQQVVRQDEYRRVTNMLRELTPLEQYLIISRVVAGRSAQEIADETGKSRGAISMMIARARDKLRDRVERDSEGEVPPINGAGT